LECAHISDTDAGIPPQHWSRLFFAHIFCAFSDDQFADLYEEGGRYPISPSLLAAITLLQFIFRVSDREAVENTIMRRDWRIALGLGPDWTGFAPTVLVRFRQRLERSQQSHRLLQATVARALDLGLLPHRRVRMDATHLVADVARLSRADALAEALRLTINALETAHPALAERPDFLRLRELYGEENWVGNGNSGEPRLRELGRDAQALLAICADYPVPAAAILARMVAENFLEAQPSAAEPEPRPLEQLPPNRILTPHDPEVKAGRKGDLRWLGDKVHVVETAEPDRPNFIIDMVVTDAHQDDSTLTIELLQRAKFLLPQVNQGLGDTGYASALNTLQAAAMGIDLLTPARPPSHRGRLPASEFALDFVRRTARCPQGQECVYWRVRSKSIEIRFPRQACADCPRRRECTSNKQGRCLHLSKNYEQLQADRARMAQPEFAELYRLRAGIEATISQLVQRCGLRRSRYRGRPGRELHALLAGAGLNAWRLIACLAEGDGVLPQAAGAMQEASCSLLPGLRGLLQGFAQALGGPPDAFRRRAARKQLAPA
jgi:transposase